MLLKSREGTRAIAAKHIVSLVKGGEITIIFPPRKGDLTNCAAWLVFFAMDGRWLGSLMGASIILLWTVFK